MCLLAFAYKVHPKFPLILIGNRDEFHNRPSREAMFWVKEGYPNILAGKDLEAGGTWLGIHKNGKWAVLTNYRDLTKTKSEAPSRGDLVLNYLKEEISMRDYAFNLRTQAQDYNGFNLILGDKEEILHYSNESDIITIIPPGIHGLSNALLNVPWKKVIRTKSGLKNAIKQIENDDINPNSFLDILLDETKAKEEDLPHTGLSKEKEMAISSPFIIGEEYGTKSAHLITIDCFGTMQFTERIFKAGTKKIKSERTFTW